MNQGHVLQGKSSAPFHLAGTNNTVHFFHALGELFDICISINNDVHVCKCMCPCCFLPYLPVFFGNMSRKSLANTSIRGF